jgi:hypothetical protein
MSTWWASPVFGDAGGACQQAKSSVQKSRLKWPVTFHLHPQTLAVDDSTLFGVLLLTFAMVQFVPRARLSRWWLSTEPCPAEAQRLSAVLGRQGVDAEHCRDQNFTDLTNGA